ncbi:hypothetical protein D3C80_1657160 [compost metagenome]
MEAHSLVDLLHRGYRRHVAGSGGADGTGPAGDGVDRFADRHAGIHRHLVDGVALAGNYHSDDGGSGIDLLRDAGRETGVSFYYPGLGTGRGGMDTGVIGVWLLRQDVRRLQRDVWQHRCNYRVAAVFLYFCRGFVAGGGNECRDRASVCRRQEPR